MSGSDSTCRVAFSDGNTVLERVLIAIINAHMTEGCKVHRLEAAMAALIGSEKPTERKLDPALRFMVRERQRDACNVEMAALVWSDAAVANSVRSIPQLAEVAAQEVMGCIAPGEIQSAAHRLCDLYRTRRNARAVAHDPVMDTLETEAVERLCVELAEWGVPTRR